MANSVSIGASVTDPSLFTSGALFTQDYLLEGITGTEKYRTIDSTAIRAALTSIVSGFPFASKPNEATTESDLIWPILAALGWTDFLTQQNLSATGRVDVPDGLLFIDATAKASANEHPEEWKRYQFGAAIIESKRWSRALDRAEGKTEKDTPSTHVGEAQVAAAVAAMVGHFLPLHNREGRIDTTP